MSPVAAEAASPDSAPTAELADVAAGFEDAAVGGVDVDVDVDVEEDPHPAAAVSSPTASRILISRFVMRPCSGLDLNSS
jgi:hypothetical protein